MSPGKAVAGKAWLDAVSTKDLQVHSAHEALKVFGFLDSGNYALNWAMSGRLTRGYPLGATVEIFGDPGTGKSFLVTRALAQAQAQGGVSMLDDTEGAYNLPWMHKLGVQTESLAYRRSRTVKEHLGLAQTFVRAVTQLREKGVLTGPGVLACDSLSLLSTEHEREVGLDKRDMSKAAELKAFFRIIGGDLADLPVVHLGTSHTIANIGAWGRTTSGGGGPKFQAGVRVDLRSLSKIKQGEEYAGVIVRAHIAKSRTTAPYKEAQFTIPFNRAISPLSGLIPLLLQLGILTLKGQFLQLDGTSTGVRGYVAKDSFLKQDQAARELLDKHPDLISRTDSLLEQKEATEPPEDWDEEASTEEATEGDG